MTDSGPHGYGGRIARVNLTTGSAGFEKLDARLCRQYLGGAGFVSYFLLKEVPPATDPLSPGNKLIFAAGPLTGFAVPGSARHCTGAGSPLTGGLAKSEAGEFWGAELKRAGSDVLIVEGRSSRPVYIFLTNDKVEIREAQHLWGKNTKETQDAIRSELGDHLVRVSSIGKAGENMVRFACIMSGLFDAAGRGGLGAVMGSKNLKAVCVRGHRAPGAVDPEKLGVLKRLFADNPRFMRGFSEYGTGANMVEFMERGNLPIRNFRDGIFPGVKNIDAETIRETIRVGMDGCFACPVRCKKAVRVNAPYTVDPAYGGPEYETLAALGSNCGIDDLKAIAKGNELCNAYSLDTISTGVVIGFAMECFEKGILTTGDTGGLDLRFGNAGAMLAAIELIARREGIGDVLAEGVARAAAKLGPQAAALAVHVKGLEPGMHEPRVKPGLGLGYMVNPHGADHCANIHDDRYTTDKQVSRELAPLGGVGPLPADDISPKKAALFRDVQLKRIIWDSLLLCTFFPYSFQQAADALSGATGRDVNINDFTDIGQRILTAARQFHIQQGQTAADDRLPPRFFQPKADGALANKQLDPAMMESAKQCYYTLMGWDSSGVPLPETLAALNIEI